MTQPPQIHVLIFGASGRMGARLCALCNENAPLRLVNAIESPGSPSIGKPAIAGDDRIRITDPAAARERIDLVIDFTSPAGARDAAALAISRSAALLVGTTGLPADVVALLRDASAKIPVLLAPNTSLGVAALASAAAHVARLLGPGYRAGIVESHHSMKKDAPSGTAIRLAKAVRDAGGDLPEDQVIALRGGDVIGEHTIRFAGPGEYIELTHRATSRDLFVRGALRAGQWLAGKPPGWYTIEQTLGL